eukprot:TRINITY_DN6408_c0_g2_i1.p1 TRINITY_DN6408_c0_g2~~TRINITY_DN6408_c0_g2_i1.p1  ORF type:complete len:383 (+),score=56.92 TRINITY_DN6408_c0_g2_i1:38-1186(+)
MQPLTDDELIVDGRAYNISSFRKFHPGGSIISFYQKTDSTHAWNEFHSRSSRAKKVLDGLPSRPVPSSTDPLLEDFETLRNQFEKEGLFKPNYPHIAYRVLELVVMHSIGLYLMFNGWPIFGMLVFSLANGRCGWLMHEGGHGSITGNPKIDKMAQSVLFGLGNGMSGAYWNNQHNKHHATPQKIGYDVDLNTLPLVAFNKETAKKGNRLWLRFQAYLFIPVVTLAVTLGWGLYLHPRYMLRTKQWLEFACYVLRLYFIYRYLSVGMFVLNALFGGIYIFLNFALSHTHKPIVPKDKHENWVVYAANHTTNINPSLLCNWWMGYLNFQIEHHLFPSMPQCNHALIAPRVKNLLEKHGLQYDIRSYWDALCATLANLDEVGKQ